MRERAPKQSHVPLYRSYGVVRNERKIILDIAQISIQAVALWVFGLLLFAFSVGFVTFLLYGQLLIVVLLYTSIITLLALTLTKPLRKRLKFLRHLKKLCRQNKYRLEIHRGFFKSFFWTRDVADLTLNANGTVYIVRFLTVRKYNSALFFENKNEIHKITYPLKNRFNTAFGIKPRHKFYPLGELEFHAQDNLKIVSAVIVNPVCREMFVKESDGSLSATGNGAQIFGIRIFTASGFIETLKREKASR